MNPLLLATPVAVVLAVAWAAERMVSRHDTRNTALPSGRRVAKTVLKRHDVAGVSVEIGVEDMYVPSQRRIELAHDRRSTSAAAIAAHEAAHAIQHHHGRPSFRLSLALALPSKLASLIWFPLAIAGEAFDSPPAQATALGLFGFTVANAMLAVWIEFDASRRALHELRTLRGLDLSAARRVLIACGLTYVADALLDLGWLGRRLRHNDEADEALDIV